MTDDQVHRVRDEPVRVAYRGLALVVQASARVSRLEQFERYDRHAELEVVHDGEVVAYIARDSEDQRLFFTPQTFDVGVLGFGSHALMDGIAAVLGERE
ncbi:hypothetical protein [Clavibacter tessellarius]|uniref:hypothetical protein n=1 Tax=Clavibacter tessellarius TaxID=31965 RepID=UPI003248DC59